MTTQLQTAVTVLKTSCSGETFMFNGVPWTAVDLIKLFNDQIATMAATDAAYAAWLQIAAKQKSGEQPVQAALRSLRLSVAMQYGTLHQLYCDFGFPVPQPRAKPTIPIRSAALAQSKATRKARNTMGKKQRLAIKGVVPPATTQPAK